MSPSRRLSQDSSTRRCLTNNPEFLNRSRPRGREASTPHLRRVLTYTASFRLLVVGKVHILHPTATTILSTSPFLKFLDRSGKDITNKSSVWRGPGKHRRVKCEDQDLERELQGVSHGLPGEHRIDTPIPTPNKMFTLHDSEGFERLQNGKFDVVHKFIKQHLEGEPENRLHAIWYVCLSPVNQFPDLRSGCISRGYARPCVNRVPLTTLTKLY